MVAWPLKECPFKRHGSSASASNSVSASGTIGLGRGDGEQTAVKEMQLHCLGGKGHA